jgi:methylglyoxal reductase
MKHMTLGTSGIEASVVGLGTWVTGGGTVWGEDPDDNESIRTIHAALDGGVNLIDTAPAYGFGRSEEVVGKAIKGRRDSVVLATKCGLLWDDPRGSEFTEFDGRWLMRSTRPDTIQEEIEASLTRLGTDCIDLYQVHWPSIPPKLTPIADTMACLMKLKDEGKIRAIGLCNMSIEELEEYCGCGDIASDQLRYSMLIRETEEEVLPLCAKKGLATLTYMSLEQGLLTGKVGMDRVFRDDEFRSNFDWNPWFAPVNRQRVVDMLNGWEDLTAKYECSLAQLVIAWTAAQDGVTHVLCGARRVDQAEQNAAAGALTIEADDLARIRADAEGLGAPA